MMTHAAAEILTAHCLSSHCLVPDIYHLVLDVPGLTQSPRPGQFMMLQVTDGPDPLLRRPISLCGASRGRIEMIIQVRGTGTRSIAASRLGATLNALGPLGTPFSTPPSLKTAVLVAGGIGAAPLLYLADHLSSCRPEVDVYFYMGAKNGETAKMVRRFLDRNARAFFVAEDGSTELCGLVTDIFTDDLKSGRFSPADACIYGCGPSPMLAALAGASQTYGLSCQVSLEAHMACGVGACLGCVVRTSDGYKRVCLDGPVFDGNVIEWSHDS